MQTITSIIIILLVVLLVLYFGGFFKNVREGYRDPLYLNRTKFVYDWYPKSNGSIYGFPVRYNGGWQLMSGYPYYDKAY
ncbi:hypothetical protein OAG24_01250 [bacterium]|nr:hypothetical protein [bacterium]